MPGELNLRSPQVFLVGVWVITRADHDRDAAGRLKYGLDTFMTRPQDRAALDLTAAPSKRRLAPLRGRPGRF